jgi:hypothetical protein
VVAADRASDLDYASIYALALGAGGFVVGSAVPVGDAASAGVSADLTLPAPGAAGSLAANKDIIVYGALSGDAAVGGGRNGDLAAWMKLYDEIAGRAKCDAAYTKQMKYYCQGATGSYSSMSAAQAACSASSSCIGVGSNNHCGTSSNNRLCTRSFTSINSNSYCVYKKDSQPQHKRLTDHCGAAGRLDPCGNCPSALLTCSSAGFITHVALGANTTSSTTVVGGSSGSFSQCLQGRGKTAPTAVYDLVHLQALVLSGQGNSNTVYSSGGLSGTLPRALGRQGEDVPGVRVAVEETFGWGRHTESERDTQSERQTDRETERDRHNHPHRAPAAA